MTNSDSCKLSVLIANRNDVAMLAISIRSIIEELRAIDAPTEIVIVENSDYHCYTYNRQVIPPDLLGTKVHVIRQDFPCLYTAYDTAARAARGEYIIQMGSHQIVGRDSLKDLVDFADSYREDPTLGFIHGPMQWINQADSRRKSDHKISWGMELGEWNKYYDHPRVISFKGFPWICRRSWFIDSDKGLNGYGAWSANKFSWGSGDMYLGIKPWLLGFVNWSIPCQPTYHIAWPVPEKPEQKPYVPIYRHYKTSGETICNIGSLVACYIFGGDEMIQRNLESIKKHYFHRNIRPDEIALAKRLGQADKDWLEKRRVYTMRDLVYDPPWEKLNSQLNLSQEGASQDAK